MKAGAVVIDNSSAFRMEPAVPLVVPEVNGHTLANHRGIIANPNCSTAQLVMALKPLHDAARIKRVIVTTYQSVSGTGKEAMQELMEQTRALMNFQEVECKVYPQQIAFNCIVNWDADPETGYTEEETKIVNETKKIMGTMRSGSPPRRPASRSSAPIARRSTSKPKRSFCRTKRARFSPLSPAWS